MWGKLGANGRKNLSSLLVHGSKRLRAAATDFCGDREALARREAPGDGAGALASVGVDGVVCDSRSSAAVVDFVDRIGDAAFGWGAGCAAGIGSPGAAFVQASVFFQGAALSDGQAGAASAARRSVWRAVLGRGGRANRWRRADRGLGASRMGQGLCRGEAGVFRDRRQARSVVANDGRFSPLPDFAWLTRSGDSGCPATACSN